jgi:hypothetical protein
MARPEKPVVGRKKGQADLFLFDPETGHRGPTELKRRHKDNGMDVLRKEQIENAAAYEKVYGKPPRVMRYLEYAGERADSDDHPFMLLTYEQDRIYTSMEAVREVFEKTAILTEAGNRAYLEEYRSDKQDDSEKPALSEDEIDETVEKSVSGRDRVRRVLDLEDAQKHAEELSQVVPGMVNVDKAQLPDTTEYERKHGTSRTELHGKLWFHMNYRRDVYFKAAEKLESKLRELGETIPVMESMHQCQR